MCACAKTSFRTLTSFPYAVLCVGGTQWVILSAAAAQNRVAPWGTLVRVLNDVFVMLATAVGGTPAA